MEIEKRVFTPLMTETSAPPEGGQSVDLEPSQGLFIALLLELFDEELMGQGLMGIPWRSSVSSTEIKLN